MTFHVLGPDIVPVEQEYLLELNVKNLYVKVQQLLVAEYVVAVTKQWTKNLLTNSHTWKVLL